MSTSVLKRGLSHPSGFAFLAAIALFVANLIVNSAFISAKELPSTFDLMMPAVLAAMASAPSILGGGGGFDLSIGPLLGFVNVMLIQVFVPHGLGNGWISVPLCLLIGVGAGAIQGAIITLLRLPAVVVTLGGYLVLSGLALVILPQAGGTAPGWVNYLSHGWGAFPRSLILLLTAMLVWGMAKRNGYVRTLEAVGSDDRAAYTAGINITRTRLLAYVVGGLLAGLAGIAASVLITSGDPNIGPQYTLVSVAAVALGGNSLAGGTGNMLGPFLGGIVIFLLQNLLAALSVSSLWIQITYGAILLVAVILNSEIRRLLIRTRIGVAA